MQTIKIPPINLHNYASVMYLIVNYPTLVYSEHNTTAVQALFVLE